MIDIFHETPIPIGQIGEVLGITQPHPGTVFRWITKGLRGGIKLETSMVGGRRYTTHEALQRFIERTTTRAAGVSAPPQTAKQRQRALDDADSVLKKAGIT